MEINDRHEVPLQAQRMEVLGRLSGAVIHDLNNLLTVIQLNAGLIGTGELEKAETLSAAGKINEASRRAAELTRKILNFARGRASETSAVHLQELVSSLSRLLEPLLARRVVIHISSGPRALWVHGDRGAIEQAIMNLVLNAVDAMPEGGRVTVAFGERAATAGMAKNNYAGIFVIDEGGGIAAEDQPKIFEPFFTTKDSGTGMGLAIVQRIARLHRGIVEFESELGKGTEFRVWLPEIAPPLDGEKRIPAVIDVQLAGCTVLLVEDDPGILALAQHLLAAMGLCVLPAATGEEALELWNSSADGIDLVFTDIVLPGKLSGVDLARKILASNPSIPVLYTSGYSGMANDQSQITAENFLQKPFSPDALERAVKLAFARA